MGDKITSGCLCGAVRYESEGPVTEAYTCHCRMCQRHTGSSYWVGAKLPEEGFRYTKGEPKRYASSGLLTRSFCPDCGSTLALVFTNPPWDDFEPGIEVPVGSLDDPDVIVPDDHYGVDTKQPWVRLEPATRQHRWDEDEGLTAAIANDRQGGA
ncbi:MAG: GFA family protein [Pseudomonadota bacterium]